MAHYRPRLLGRETIRGEACWRLELTPSTPRGLYHKIHAWITEDGFRPFRFDYYGQTDTLLKTAYYQDYRDGPVGVRSMRIHVTNHLRPGEETTLTFSNLRPFPSGDFDYSKGAMSPFRDRAQASFDATGEQPSLEQLRPVSGEKTP